VTDPERIEAARRAGFYPLMLLLERLQPGRAALGTASPAEEGVRFRHDPSLTFSTSDVSEVRRRELPPDPENFSAQQQELVEITTTFLGLTGAVSPLPSYFAEEVAQDPESRQRDFLDIFHHRLVSLFFRAVARYDIPNTRRSDGADAWSRRLLALAGFDAEATDAQRFGLPSWRILRLAPLLAERELTAQALQTALSDMLSDLLESGRVEVEQFVGAWGEVAADQLTRLGQQAHALGRDFFLGRRVFDRANNYRIVVGPLSAAEYPRFSEGSDALRQISSMVASIASAPLDYEVWLLLSPDATPSLQLSSRGRSRLARNAWLGGRSRESRIRVQVPSPVSS
jgi:type VI secretion system protein ImpH